MKTTLLVSFSPLLVNLFLQSDISNRLMVIEACPAQADHCPATPDVPHIQLWTLGVGFVMRVAKTAGIATLSLIDDLILCPARMSF